MSPAYKNVSRFLHIRNAGVICLLILTTLAGGSNVLAIPQATYRERVNQSMVVLDSLRSADKERDDWSRKERDAEALAEVRRLMPPVETVDVEGYSLQVDNKWLETALLDYEESFDSEERRNAVLTQTIERLAALAAALAELNNPGAVGTSAPNKDEAKARLANILRRDEYAKQAEEGNALTRLWRRFLDWISDILPSAPQMEPERASLLSQLAQILVVGLALAVISYVAWKFSPRMWRSSAKAKKSGKREARVVLGERLEPDQTSADLLAEAEVLAREGQLRAAIRKGYIALLCELGDRKVLGLAQHKTNRDYLRSVRGHEQLFQEMQLLTNSFENHWYGFVPANMDDWNMFRARYHQALKQG